MRAFLIVLCALMVVSACARYDEETPIAQVEEYDHAPESGTKEKPLGPIFGEGYVR
ncbi:MAG: hypothetical protein AAF569_07640 [Pseudomonadota bacterium]